MNVYFLSWACADCGTQNKKPLTKTEAAFCGTLKIDRTLRCQMCGGARVKSSACVMPEVDDELIQAWLANPKLHFLEQDEELILAGIDARRLVALLGDPATPKSRRGSLLLGLMHKVGTGKFSDSEEEQTAKDYLRRNRAAWKDAKRIRFQIRKAALDALGKD